MSCAHTPSAETIASIVADLRYVPMARTSTTAKTARERVSAFTASESHCVVSAEALASVAMGKRSLIASSVEARGYVSTTRSSDYARHAKVQPSVSTAAERQSVRTVGARDYGKKILA